MFSISNVTLSSFFIIHIALLFAILGLVLSHILILHEKGSSYVNFLVTDKIAFFPSYLAKNRFGLTNMLIGVLEFIGGLDIYSGMALGLPTGILVGSSASRAYNYYKKNSSDRIEVVALI